MLKLLLNSSAPSGRLALPLAIAISVTNAGPGYSAQTDEVPVQFADQNRSQFKLPINDSVSSVKQANIRTDQYIPKSPLEEIAPISIKTNSAKTPKDLVKEEAESTRSLNMAPLPLLDSPEDTQKYKDQTRELEREQLTALWEATLANSVDIGFVMQKLMPSESPGRVTSLMMRSLSTLLYGGISSVRAFSPGLVGSATSNIGVSILSNILSIRDKESLQKARVTQVEQILLFDMVRRTADRLVEKYRNYKKVYKNLLRARDDFASLKNMAESVRQEQDASEQFTVDYTLRKQRREIEEIEEDLNIFRQALIDLAGRKAVEEFEAKVSEELSEIYPQVINEKY